MDQSVQDNLLSIWVRLCRRKNKLNTIRMFSMNKETMMMVAVVVSLLASFYIYKDMQKTKLELQKLNEVPVHVPPPTKSILKKVEKKEVVIADESE